jgi:hypothetical protein
LGRRSNHARSRVHHHRPVSIQAAPLGPPLPILDAFTAERRQPLTPPRETAGRAGLLTLPARTYAITSFPKTCPAQHVYDVVADAPEAHVVAGTLWFGLSTGAGGAQANKIGRKR